MATSTTNRLPEDGEFQIVQGDSLPLMRIPILPNSNGELPDLAGCTVTFMGRKAGTRDYPPPITREMHSYAAETEGGVACVAVYVKLTTADTQGITTTSKDFVEMQGELKVVDENGDPITIQCGDPAKRGYPYLIWWIVDAIGVAS